MDGWDDDDDVFDDETFDDITTTATTHRASESNDAPPTVNSFRQQDMSSNLNMHNTNPSDTNAMNLKSGYNVSDTRENRDTTDGRSDRDDLDSAENEGLFSRAAGAFGAALLADVDADDNNHDEKDVESSARGDGHFGFGGGFVMKGLRGFIDKATAAATPEGWEDEDLEEDGWSDEDLDGAIEEEEDEDNVMAVGANEQAGNVGAQTEAKAYAAEEVATGKEVIDEPELQDEPINENGWDEFDLDVSGDQPEENQQIETAMVSESGTNNSDVSDSLRDFVAKTETTLTLAFNDATKTPTRTPRDPMVVEQIDEEDMRDTNNNDAAVSKSLTDFVDNLDAQLNELKGSMEEVEKEAVLHQDEYNFEENKNNSPEPITTDTRQANTMPHQDSWYLNAMEGGAGGIVNSEKVEPSTDEHPKETVLPLNSDLSMNDLPPSETPVGMPISEMPSVVNSRSSSNENLMSANNCNLDSMSSNATENTCNYQQSELQCKCLELILPLPGNGNEPSEESGFGTKTLPDGTTVLVNYEKLLLNEATKRILLQRSVETYERTMEKMQAKFHSVLNSSKEHEEASQLLQSQLDNAQNENVRLKEMMAQLEQEKEQMMAETSSSEAHLFQEELAAAAAERELLQKQLSELQELLKQSREEHTAAIEARDDFGKRLDNTKTEQSRLEDLVQMIQSDLSEAQQTCSLLQSENDALQEELDAKSKENVVAESSEQTEFLNEKIFALENELRMKSSECDSLNDQISEIISEQSSRGFAVEHLKQENDALSSEVAEMRELLANAENEKESLRVLQSDSQARIIELTAMVESMDNSSAEVDRLAAENASLTYELGIKSTENDQHVISLKALQAELDDANSRLSAIDQNTSDEGAVSEVEASLRAENEVLKTNFGILQNDFGILEQSKLGLEASLSERDEDVENMKAQVDDLQKQVYEAQQLKSEVSELKETINRKENELQEMVMAKEHLNSQLLSNNNDQLLAKSQEELTTLHAQFDEYKQHHNTTMGYMEEQLSGLMEQKSTSDAQLDECRIELDRVQRENSKLSAALKVAQTNDDLKTSQDQIRVQELENERTQLRVMLDHQQHDLNNQRQAFDDLSQEYEDLRSEFERVQMEHGNVLARNRALEQDNKSLEFQLNETSTKSNQAAAAHRALEQDKNALELQLKEASLKHEKLEAKLSSLQAQMEEQEKEALDAIAQWEARCSSLESSRNASDQSTVEVERLQQEVATLTSQLGVVTTQLDSIQTSNSAEREKLLLRISELEEELKDENLNELRDELTSLHEERQQLDLDNEELLVQLGLMQQSKVEHDEELQHELTRLRGQVATLQDNVSHLRSQLEQERSTTASSGNNGLDAVVEKLHQENSDLQQNISRLSKEKCSLENDIDSLTKTVNNLEQQLSGNSSVNNAEVQRLKSQVQELETMLSEQEQRTTHVKQPQTQVHELEAQLSQKDQEAAVSAEEMRQVEAKSIVDSMPTNFNDEEEEKEYEDDDDDDSLQDLLVEEIDSDDYLRNQIVILAQALERSELQRADVLDRLTRERKYNADSLKQLGESVKRFYSTVRSGGAS